MTLPLDERGHIVRGYAERHRLRVLIETGSGDGCTAGLLAPHFERVFTIEVSPEKYFGVWGALVGYPHVLPILGDSEVVLPHLLSKLDEPAIFWLDAHYDGGTSGRGRVDTPIQQELFTIFANKRERPNVILIDDARFFGTDPAYPTVAWIATMVPSWCDGFGWPPYSVDVADDIIRLEPLD